MSNQPQHANSAGHLNFKLPGGQGFSVDDLNMTLSALMDTARKILSEDKITSENFGVDKHFFSSIARREL